MSVTAVIDWRVEEGQMKAVVVDDQGNETDVGWTPQKGSQEVFLATQAEEVMYEGTRGPGKTDALLMSFGQYVGHGWGAEWRGILFRQTYPQLSDVIVKSKKWFPQIWPKGSANEAKYNESSHVWTWTSGETLTFAYGNKEKDYWNYHGKEWPWMAFEELTTWAAPAFFLKMFSCCRSTVPGMPRMIRATTNPYGPGHNWVKMRYNLPLAPSMIEGPLIEDPDGDMPERMAVHGFLDENKILLTADPDYKKRLRAASKGNDALLKAWLFGSWDIVAGGMFDDLWNPERHVVPNFEVPWSWRIDRSFDWGSSSPFSVGWWAESDGSDLLLPDGRLCSTVKGDLFRIGEWYGWNGEPNIGLRMTATDIAKGIIEREIAMGIHDRCKAGPADASCFKTENGVSYAADLMKSVYIAGKKRRVKFVPSNSSPGTRKVGWELMRRRLLAANPEEPGPREFPGLFVCSRCTQFLRTVPVLPRDLDRDPDDAFSDGEDHIADESRYRVMMAGWATGGGRLTGVAS